MQVSVHGQLALPQTRCMVQNLFRRVMLVLQELVNRWSEQIYGAHRDERETADLRERHAQMQEARSARKRAEQSAAAEDADKPVSHLNLLMHMCSIVKEGMDSIKHVKVSRGLTVWAYICRC